MEHVLQSWHVSKSGKAKTVILADMPSSTVKEGYLWIHLDGTKESCRTWLRDDPDVDAIAERTLLGGDARPRTIAHEQNVLINLRGVNLNPGSQPEDMIGIRFFVESRRIISVERRPLRATQDLATRMKTQLVPTTTGGFLATYAMYVADRMAPTITDLNEQVDTLEEKVDAKKSDDSRQVLSELRRNAILLRRYLAPQRDALNTLALQTVPWITPDDRLRIREAADQATRVNEELEAIRERAAIVKDQLTDQRAEEMNRNMMVLSVVAAVFLPLGLISGMMGINVGGMPWTETKMGFWYVTAIVFGVGVILLAIFKWAKWL